MFLDRIMVKSLCAVPDLSRCSIDTVGEDIANALTMSYSIK